MRNSTIDFFGNTDVKNNNDILIFYYSGLCIADIDGNLYFAPSNINPDAPFARGLSFEELARFINFNRRSRVVIIIDCCYDQVLNLRMGNENERKWILAASQTFEEAYKQQQKGHSIFTYYLINGLKGNDKSVDVNGNVTTYSLGTYIDGAILSLPAEKRPKQRPIIKGAASGNIILARYPNLARSHMAVDGFNPY